MIRKVTEFNRIFSGTKNVILTNRRIPRKLGYVVSIGGKNIFRYTKREAKKIIEFYENRQIN